MNHVTCVGKSHDLCIHDNETGFLNLIGESILAIFMDLAILFFCGYVYHMPSCTPLT